MPSSRAVSPEDSGESGPGATSGGASGSGSDEGGKSVP